MKSYKKLWILFLSTCFAVMAFAQKVKIMSEKQVGKDGASTKFSYFGTSPESPDGKTVIYLRLKKEPIGLERTALVPGELWICNTDLTGHRMVTEIKGMSSEDGCQQQWINNRYVALIDSQVIRVIDVRNGQDILKKRIETRFISHDVSKGRMLYTITKAQQTATPGIYELNCLTGAVKPLLMSKDCKGVVLPSYLDPAKVSPAEDWRMIHCQYSPNGKKICFRIDTGPTETYELLGVCNRDGSGLTVMPKPLHQQWYDNKSIMGHARFDEEGQILSDDKRFHLMRWDLNGKYIETMGPLGNHLAASPNRRYFASETMYNISPVVVSIFPHSRENELTQVASFDPYNLTWNEFFHVNPAFSRDGKRLYYCRPLNQQFSGTFVCDLKLE